MNYKLNFNIISNEKVVNEYILLAGRNNQEGGAS